MIIGTILMTLLTTIVELIMKAVTYVGTQILDESVVTFSANSNIFENFVNLIPFGSDLHVAALVKGIAFGLIIILVIVSAIRAFTAPISGEESPNLIQVVIRAAFAIILIIIVYGPHFSSTATYNGSTLENVGTMRFDGVLGLVGKFFGNILSYINMNSNTIDVELKFASLDPANSIGYLILLLALVSQVVSAAITLLERFVSLGISVICGPIMIAMYTSPESKDTTKNWALSIFTQFLAIFLSMILWVSFINQANKSFDSGSIFQLAVAIVILTMVRNSEKILNTFGLRTLSVGDSARALTGGVALATGAVMMGSRLVGMAGKARAAGSNNGKVAGVGNAYSTDHTSLNMQNGSFYGKEGGRGVFGGDSGHRYSQQISSAFKQGGPVKAIQSIRNSVAQNKAINEIKSARDSGANTTAKYFNDTFGNSSINVVGSGPSGVMHNVSATSTDGNKAIRGFEGAVSYTSPTGRQELIEHAFIPVGDRPNQIQPGSSIGVIDGQERFIENSGIITDPYSGQSFYRTTTINPDISFNDLGKKVEEPLNYKSNEKTIVSETEYPAKN